VTWAAGDMGSCEGEQEDLYMITGIDMMFCLVMSSINLFVGDMGGGEA